MIRPLRFLVAESEPPEGRRQRREGVGRSSGETYLATLRSLAPEAECDVVRPADAGATLPDGGEIGGYDAVFVTGSPLHLYEDTPPVRRQLDFMRAVFAAGVPAFGSCAGLQAATVAAGGTVRPCRNGREAGFARRITPTDAGRAHPLLAGRPAAFDAPAAHSDEVASLPEGATLLASNGSTRVQAAEIRFDRGVFWGVQYHPEIPLPEIAESLRLHADDLVRDGLADSTASVETHADLIHALGENPERRDLAWRLGIDREVTRAERRLTELRNFIEHLVKPTLAARG